MLPVGQWGTQLWDVLTRENQIGYQLADKPIRTSRVLTFPITLESTRDLDKITAEKMEEQVAMRLGVDSVRIARYLGAVMVEVQLPSGYHRPLLVRALHRKSGLWLTLGQTARGGQVHVNMGGSLYPHALIGATTGGGKTCTMRLMLWELAMQNSADVFQALVLDGKGGANWRDFESLPHLAHPILASADEALHALAWALAETDRRKSAGYNANLFIFVDEIKELLACTGGDKGPVAAAFNSLSSIGRELGVHLILATQHPTADAVGGTLTKANLPLRLAGRVTDAHASNLVTGQRDLRAHRLYGEGDFLADGHRVQIALLDERYMAKLPHDGQKPHEIDLSLDLNRVVDVVGSSSETRNGPLPVQVAWAVWDYLSRPNEVQQPSAKAIRDHFGGAMDTARAVRDFAAELVATFEQLGVGLRVTDLLESASLPIMA